MEALLTNESQILMVLFVCVAMAFLLQKFKFFKTFGPAILCIIFGITLGNLKIIPHWHDVYGVFFEYAVPLSLTMFLLSVDLKEWLRLSKQPLLAMTFAVLSVSIVTIIAGLIFVPGIEEGWKIAGMFVGTYTGGSANLTAIGSGLNASPNVFASANAADYVVGFPTIIIFFALPGILAKSKWFKKVWPYSLTEEELSGNNDVNLFSKQEWSIIDIAVTFGIAFFVTQLATTLSTKFNEGSAMKIIFISTIAITIAQFKPIKRLKGNMDLGFFVASFFLMIIGLLVDIKQFAVTVPTIAIFCFTIIIFSLLLHVALCRLFKIKYQYVLISIVASIGDGSTSAMVAGAGNWKSIMGIAVVLGVIGAAIGNYLGIGIAYLLKALTGM